MRPNMARFARWHIWLAWLAGIPVLMWTITGLVMVSRPIEEVRGEHLRTDASQIDISLPRDIVVPAALELGSREIEEIRFAAPDGVPTTFVTRRGGAIERYNALTGALLPPVTAREAALIAVKGTRVDGVSPLQRRRKLPTAVLFEDGRKARDFRRPQPVWQVTLANGTHVYVGAQTARIEAVRTRWWRVFDFMWGLHIMDLQEREDTSHPLLILFAALAAIASLLGIILMFRRRTRFLHR